jgi:opacity protein-like surface antigen
MRNLKRNIFLVTLVLSSFSVNSQALLKGTLIIDPYYGAPTIGKTTANRFVGREYTYDVSNITGIGPAGVRVEYMLSDYFGLGLDLIYNSTDFDLSYDSLNLDQTVYQTYTGSASMKRLRIQLRLNYHYELTDQLDAYLGVGVGANTRVWSVVNHQAAYKFVNSNTVFLPLSMRLAVGMRYYFSSNIGINTEIGLGGPFISAGLSIKI